MSDDQSTGDTPATGPDSPNSSSGSSDQPASQDSGLFYEPSPSDTSSSETSFYDPSAEPQGLEDISPEDGNREAEKGDGVADTTSDTRDGFIKLPGEGASDEDINTFYAALGVPDSPEGYELVIPKELGADQSGADWKEYAGAISELSHALGLSPNQAQALAELDLQAKTQSIETMEQEQQHYLKQQIEDTTTALRQEWGPNMDVNVRTANRALKAFGGSELEGVLSEAGVLNDPVVLRAFHKAGLSLVEDSSPGGAGATRRNKSAADILYPSSTKEG